MTVGTRSSSNHRLPLVPDLTIRQIAVPSPFMRARRSTVAVVILALAAALIGGWWTLSARHHFTGPRTMGSLDEIISIEAQLDA